MMYNEEFKQKYIKYCQDVETKGIDTIRKMIKVFNDAEGYEEKLKKDIWEMDHNELFDMFHYFKKYNVGVIRVYHSILKGYIDWCMIEKRFKINLLKVRITPTLIISSLPDEGVKGKYFNNEEFEKYKERVKLAYDNKVSTYILSIVELAYQCACREAKEIFELRYSEIDFDKKLIYGKAVTEELLTLLKNAYLIDEIVFKRKSKNNLNCRIYDDSIFKFTSNDNTKYHKFFQTIMTRFREATNTNLTMDNIYQCGLIHFVNQEYCKNNNKNFIEDLQSKSKDLEIAKLILQKDAMSVIVFRNKYLKIIKYCI